MNGANLVATLQKDVGRKLSERRAHYEFSPVWVKASGYTLQTLTLKDSITVDGVRVPVTAKDLQEIADLLDCTMPTARMVDLRYIQARKDGLVPEPVFNTGSSVRTWKGKTYQPWTIAANMPADLYSSLVDERLASQREKYPEHEFGIHEGVGKTWVICEGLDGQSRHKLASAYNYGWHTREGGWTSRAVTPMDGRFVAQPLVGPYTQLLHNDDHADPSQGTFALYALEALLTHPDGKEELVDIRRILTDPKLAQMLSHEGPLPDKCLRQPRARQLQALDMVSDVRLDYLGQQP